MQKDVRLVKLFAQFRLGNEPGEMNRAAIWSSRARISSSPRSGPFPAIVKLAFGIWRAKCAKARKLV